MSTSTPPPKPPLTLSPRPATSATPPPPVDEPEGLPTFGTEGIPLATALLRLGVPLLAVAAVTVFSLFSSTIGLILGGVVLLAGLAAVVLPALRGRSGPGRLGGRRPGGNRLGRLLSGGRPGGLRSRAAGGLARARNGRFASRLRGLTGGRFPRPGGGRSPGGARPLGGSRASRLLGKARGLLPSRRPGGRAGRSGASRAGGRPGGRAGGGRGLGRFLSRGKPGGRSAHGSTGGPGGRAPGKGGSKSRGSTPSRGRGLLGKLTGGRLGRPGPGGRKPSGGAGGSPSRPKGFGASGGPRGKGPSKSGGKNGGKGRGKGGSGNWGTPGVEAVSFGFVRGWIGLGKFVGNRVRGVDVGAVVDALKTPFKPGPPKPTPDFEAGIDDGASDPIPDWFPGQTAADYVWPGQSTVDDYAWPKDHDKSKKKDKKSAPAATSPHPSPHPPEQREHREMPVITDRRTGMAVDVTDYSSHFENLTEESTAADRKTALNEAAQDASARHQKQVQEAERLRADARAAAKFPDRVAELNTKAATLEGDAEKNRLLSSHFTTRSAEQTD